MTGDGRFGLFGGRYMPETLMEAVLELEAAYDRYRDDPGFRAALDRLLSEYAGRPTPLTFAPRLTADLGCRVYLKREDLLHGGRAQAEQHARAGPAREDTWARRG